MSQLHEVSGADKYTGDDGTTTTDPRTPNDKLLAQAHWSLRPPLTYPSLSFLRLRPAERKGDSTSPVVPGSSPFVVSCNRQVLAVTPRPSWLPRRLNQCRLLSYQ